MSSAVVWKNLQLFDSVEAAREEQSNKGAKGKSNGKKQLQINAQRRGVKKNLKKAKREQFQQRSTILGEKGLLLPSLKHSGPKINTNLAEDTLQANLIQLKNFSQIAAVDLKSAEKILARATRREFKLVKETKKDTSSIFTEADFAKFAKNYVSDD